MEKEVIRKEKIFRLIKDNVYSRIVINNNDAEFFIDNGVFFIRNPILVIDLIYNSVLISNQQDKFTQFLTNYINIIKETLDNYEVIAGVVDDVADRYYDIYEKILKEKLQNTAYNPDECEIYLGPAFEAITENIYDIWKSILVDIYNGNKLIHSIYKLYNLIDEKIIDYINNNYKELYYYSGY